MSRWPPGRAYRSPYLFEALAVIHQTQGNNAQARQAIQQAQQAAPDDTIIETEASFIQTGQPPPPRPPPRPPPPARPSATRTAWTKLSVSSQSTASERSI